MVGEEGSRRAATAGRMALGWSLWVTLGGLVLLIALPLIGPDRSYCENGDHPGPCTSRVELALPGLVVTAIGAWCLAASIGLRRQQRGGRRAVVVTFSLWAFAAFAGVADSVTRPDGVHAGDVIVAALFLAYFATTAAWAADWRSGAT